MYESRMQCMPLTYKIQLELLETVSPVHQCSVSPKVPKDIPTANVYTTWQAIYQQTYIHSHTLPHTYTHTATHISHSPTTGTFSNKHKL